MDSIHRPYGTYERFFKRPLDLVLSLLALILLSPLLIVLVIIGAIIMKGNPFFVQQRPGRINRYTGQEKIFFLIKFRTMSNVKDANGDLLPDNERLNAYGRLLRSTSCDELPELINILKGDMAIIGPRPLLVKYLPLYSSEQHRRHEVRPGLSGYAQVHGRNAISWTERFKLDVKYVDHITFWGDIKILINTFIKVFRREGIHSVTSDTMESFNGNN